MISNKSEGKISVGKIEGTKLWYYDPSNIFKFEGVWL